MLWWGVVAAAGGMEDQQSALSVRSDCCTAGKPLCNVRAEASDA